MYLDLLNVVQVSAFKIKNVLGKNFFYVFIKTAIFCTFWESEEICKKVKCKHVMKIFIIFVAIECCYEDEAAIRYLTNSCEEPCRASKKE